MENVNGKNYSKNNNNLIKSMVSRYEMSKPLQEGNSSYPEIRTLVPLKGNNGNKGTVLFFFSPAFKW